MTAPLIPARSEEHTSELQSRRDLVCRLLLDTLYLAIYTLSLHDALPISDLDVDFFVHDRIHEHRRKARVSSRLGIERRDAHEPMNSRFRLQKSERIRPLDLDDRTLDTR